MANSQSKSGGVVTVSVKVSGSAIGDSIEVHRIHIEKAINRIATATITILDGNASTEKFSVSSSDTFVPGNEVTIEAGYDASNKLLFKGIVCQQGVRIDNSSGPLLQVICKDAAIKMTVGRKSGAYSKATDSEVISKLIGNYSALSADVSSTSVQLPELVQYYVSDWDFMLSRAEINSMLVSTINGKVSVFSPTDDTSSVLTLTYGENLYHFNGDLNATTQLESVKASAWSYQEQKLIDSSAANSVTGPGNLSSKKLASVVGLSDFELQSTAPETSEELTTWAKGQMLKSELSKILAEVRFQGTSAIEPGNYVSLDGIGSRFDGDHFVSSVSHDISEGNWLSEAKLGLTPIWFVQDHEVQAPPAAGLLPAIQGLYNATVVKIYDDPDSQYRILVDVPLFNDNGEGLWARLTNFYSTSGQGVFFLPEVGDEVIVGFLNQDPRYPIILGSVYSSKNKPYSELNPNEKNSIKAIVTKSELQISFDDENKILTLITPNKNQLVLSDKGQEIELKDQNNNSITMSSSGIEIKSATDVNITAEQNVSIKGNTGVSIQASGGDVTVKGINISETADAQYTAKGNATAQVQGGGELTLKGALVMIN